MIRYLPGCRDRRSSFAAHAFRYYMPALIRMAFDKDYYVDQLLFHLNSPGRIEAMTGLEAQAVHEALWVLVESKGEVIPDNFDEPGVEQAIGLLEKRFIVD